MSPISAEMNGNLSGKEIGGRSTKSMSGTSGSGDSSLDTTDGTGGFSGSDSQPNSGRPMTTSTPIQDHDENELEQPTSSTGSNYGGTGSGGSDSVANNGAPKFGTMIPNRVFVGGISPQTTEHELVALFSQFGAVRGAKIIMDRGGISKGYGFITFETEEEAKRLYNPGPNREIGPIYHRDRRLNIAPAVKKQVTMQPMMRPGIPYSSPSDGLLSSGGPPPYSSVMNSGQGSQAHAAQAAAAAAAAAASYFYSTSAQGQGDGQQYYCTPGPIPEPYYQQQHQLQQHQQQQQTSGSGASVVQTTSNSTGGYNNGHSSGGALHAAQYYNPNGQNNAGGTIYFLQHPTLPPYQQALTTPTDHWAAAAGLGAGSGLNGSQWRYMTGPNSMSLPPQNPYAPCHAGLGTQSMQNSPPQGHPYLQDFLGHASTFGPSDFLFFNPSVISSPH